MTWPKSRVPVQINNWSVIRNHTARVIRSCTLTWSPSLKARVKSGLVFVTTWRISTVNFWQAFTPLSFLLLNIAWTWLWLLSSIYLNSQFYSHEVLREGNVMSPKNKNETTVPHFLYLFEQLHQKVQHVTLIEFFFFFKGCCYGSWLLMFMTNLHYIFVLMALTSQCWLPVHPTVS